MQNRLCHSQKRACVTDSIQKPAAHLTGGSRLLRPLLGVFAPQSWPFETPRSLPACSPGRWSRVRERKGRYFIMLLDSLICDILCDDISENQVEPRAYFQGEAKSAFGRQVTLEPTAPESRTSRTRWFIWPGLHMR